MSISRNGVFAPLRDYAMLGDMSGTALVALGGSIDWWAMPRLDSAPVCAALLDPARGGSLTLSPSVPYSVSRRYLPGTMVLETRFETDAGIVRVTDALTMGALGPLPWTELAQVVEVDEGEVPLAWALTPGHRLSAGGGPWARTVAGVALILVGDCHLAVVCEGLGEARIGDGCISGETMLRAGESGLLGVIGTRGEPTHVPRPDEIRERVEHTIETWRHWSKLSGYAGRWSEQVQRSALVLKSLSLKANGAIAGAATTSLPEQPGGSRNFDYRFAWVRDAAFSLDAMARLGFSEEVHAGITWLLDAVAPEAPGLRVFYDLDGEPTSTEMTEVDGVAGYRGSLPVHVGNGAADQLQLGAFGHLMDAVWHCTDHGGMLDAASAALLGALADHVCDIWRSPDAGFWELGSPEHYTSSKLGCWVALRRAVQLIDAGQLHHPHAERWRVEQARIRAFIDDRCWSKVKHSYTFHADCDELDATVLLMVRFGFCDADDPRLKTTVDAILSELDAGHALLYRYSGQQDKEGAFLACTGWMIEALVHVRRLTDAEEQFAQFLEHPNDVGLLTEEIDPESLDLLGNVPQALSHLALINAATTLDAALTDDANARSAMKPALAHS